MRKQVLFLLAIMVNSVMFGQLYWTNGGGDNQYNNENNWDEGYVPDETTDVRMDGRVSLDDLIVSEASIGDVTTSGIAGVAAGRMIIKPTGSLVFAGSRWSAIGWDAECTLIVEPGGYVEFGEHLWLGFNSGANSHMYVYGTVRVNAMYGQNFEGKGTDGSSSSDVIIYNGGHLDLAQWADDGRSMQGATHTLSIMGGALMTVPGDYTTQLETDVAEGNLLAPGGSIQIVFVPGDNPDEDPGLTTVTSSAEPIVPSQLTWNNGTGDGQYNTGHNWNGGFAPEETTDVRMDGRVSLDDLIVSEASVGDVTTSGIAGVDAGRMIIKPTGSLVLAGSRWSAIGWDAECTLIVEPGGYVEFGEHLWLGFNSGANSHMYVYGTVRVNAMYGQNFEGKGTDGSSSSDVIIYNGGHLDLAQWADDGRSMQGATHTLSIMGGALMTVPGDYTTQLETDVAEGNLLAPGGSIQIVFVPGDNPDEDPGLTTVTSSAEPLSLKDYETLDFSVYPNPSSDNISIQSKTEISNVQLFNSSGQNVLEVKGKSNIDISKLSAGLYFLKVQDAEGNLGVKRVIKQ